MSRAFLLAFRLEKNVLYIDAVAAESCLHGAVVHKPSALTGFVSEQATIRTPGALLNVYCMYVCMYIHTIHTYSYI